MGDNAERNKAKIYAKTHELKKRPPHRLPASENEIYITKKSAFPFQLGKCRELLNSGENEIILHGLGAAVGKCCNLALQLQKSYEHTCQIEVNTSTVDLIDDLEPCTEDAEFGAQVRQNSAVHIRIFKTSPLAKAVGSN